MLGFLKRKGQDAAANMKKLENKDLMEAIVGGCLLVAYADGDCSDEEILNLDGLIQSNPALSHFGSEITNTINTFEQQLKTGFRVGKLKIMREIKDIKNNPEDAEEVFINMITIAEADGEVDEKETAVLKEVGQALGQRLSDYGLE